MEPIRILIVDDHALVRAGIRLLLERLPGMYVIGEAADGIEALELVEAHNPDIVLLDITMPRLDGLETAAAITKKMGTVKIIMLSMHSAEQYVGQALRAGAMGYLVKDSAPAELDIAIRAVARGETYLSPAVSKHVIADYLEHKQTESGELGLLTPRQREILQLLAEGYSIRDTARALKISAKTVEAHRTQVAERLGIRDITGLVRFAIRVGLVKAE